MGEGSSGEQAFTRQSRRKELPGGVNSVYKGTKARQSLVCLGEMQMVQRPQKGGAGREEKVRGRLAW